MFYNAVIRPCLLNIDNYPRPHIYFWYHLTKEADKMPFSEEKITKYLKNTVSVRVYGSIDSTNSEARRRAATDKGFCLYAASHQTAGRGRRGHTFYSPADTGLYMTLSLPIYGELSDVQPGTCAAGVAVCEAIEELTDCKPQIKWVNDILIDGKKVAGILAEVICNDNEPSAVIVGIGVNLKTDSFPDEFADRAASVGDIEPEALCAAITDKLIGYYNDLSNNSIMEKYRERNICIGKTVTFTKDGKRITAEAVGIDRDGGLTVDINGERITLNSGEISVEI